MKNYKLHISEGFKDTCGTDMLIQREIENRTLVAFRSYGYEYIKTPAVEYIDVYSANGLQKPDLYNLINRQGEVLALCNDMTSSIARFVCSNTIGAPAKYCYIADTFRYPRQYQGKQHQFLQAGVEFIGEDGLFSDVECISLAYQCLKSCNISDFTIHIGSARFLDVLLEDFQISTALKDAIYTAIETKDYVSLKEILTRNIEPEKATFIIDLMLRGGKLRYIERLMLELKGTKSYDELRYLKEIYTALRELGIEHIIFDFSIYSYAKYYTGVIFSVYVDHIAKAVVEGGRSDTLFRQFGREMTDIGFGMDIDSLTAYVKRKEAICISEEKYLCFAQKDSLAYASRTNDSFRESGIIVNQLSFSSLEEALKYARGHHYTRVIEYKGNTFTLWEVSE